MCGIAGIIALDRRPVTAAQAAAMAAVLAHRGPDGEGVMQEGPVALAHRRLSIIDIEGGKQPLASTTGHTVTSYNGEIYNFRELAHELASDYEFKTRSDTEVVLAGYERWGVSSFTKFEGMFAFALLDRRRRMVYLVRDPIGVKPLYYARSGHTLYFASEIKAILEALPARPALRREAINAYFQRQYIGHQITIYEGIESLLPASYLEVNLDSGAMAVRPYWELQVEPGAPKTSDDASAELEQVLRAAAVSQLVADVPVGVFLSGGLDSTTLLALATAGAERRLSTFSVAFAGSKLDESQFARRAAQHFGSEHHELAVDAESAVAELPRIVAAMDQPLADYAMLPTFIMSRFAAERVKVVLGGEGADEVFGGYLRRYLPQLIAERTGGWIIPRTLRAPKIFGERDRKRLLGDAYLAAGKLPTEQALRADLAKFRRYGLFNAALLTDLHHWLPADLLMKIDSMGMLASLEARVPYLDRRVVELVAGWPAAQKIKRGQTKVALRQLARRLLPAELADRKKHGFTVPVGDWFRTRLKSWFEERVLCDGPAARHLHMPTVHTLWQEHQRGRDHGLQLWCLLIFAWWLETRR